MVSSKMPLLALALVASVFVLTLAAPQTQNKRGFAVYPCDPSTGACPNNQYCAGYNATVGFSTCAKKKCPGTSCAAATECASGTCILGVCGPCIGCC